MRSNPMRKFDCAVIGSWHLAFITAASLSSLGKRVVLVNPNGDVSPWEEFPTLDLQEPGLEVLIAESRKKGLLDFANHFDRTDSGWDANILWLAIDTPVNDRDEADVTPLLAVAKKASQLYQDRIFALSSQIPLGFCGKLEREYGLVPCYVPENLRLGKGLETFLKADRTVIGANQSFAQERVRSLLEGIQTDTFLCDCVTAEMIKHATNAFLASSISFANELARIGERMGVDNQKVAQGLKLDKRIGKAAYVAPGLGFAGGTLPRDLRILQTLGKELQVPTSFINAVLEVNETGYQALVNSISQALGGLTGRKILILGYSYKADIDTLRRSPAVELAKLLGTQGADVSGFDPVMNARDLSSLRTSASQGGIRHCMSWDDLGECPDALIVMTARPDFKNLDWTKPLLAKKPGDKSKPLLLDACSIVDLPSAQKAGWAVKALWQPISGA